MRLSSTAGRPLYEELLLLLQPLSLLTFNLDLLFQHHHLEPVNHSPQISTLPAQDAGGFRLTPQGALSKGGRASSSSSSSAHLESLSKLDLGGPEDKEATSETSSSSVASSDDQGSGMPPHSESPLLEGPVSVKHTSPQLLWVQEKEIRDLPPPAIDDGSLTQQAGQVRRGAARSLQTSGFPPSCANVFPSHVGDPGQLGGSDAPGRASESQPV